MSTPSAEESIFLAALEKGTEEERAAYLDQACGADQALRRQVDRLLAAHPKVGGFLEQPAFEPAADRTVGDGPAGAAGAGPPSREGGGGTQAETPGEAPVPLDFLGPSRRPGSLGRLGHY